MISGLAAIICVDMSFIFQDAGAAVAQVAVEFFVMIAM